MRKGADVLSKWVGESERQLRLLFAEAQKREPAIIFFDEIDGTALGVSQIQAHCLRR
jgi:SpoVK/Ycf46/Vps4 family AAA+-type ATPase